MNKIGKTTKLSDMDTAIIEGRELITLTQDQTYNESTGLVTDYSGLRAEGAVTDSSALVDEEMAEILLQTDNKMFRESKEDYITTMFNKTGNIKYTKGRKNGRSFIQREQTNLKEIKVKCAREREFHRKVLASGTDSLKELGMSPTFRLPRVVLDNILESIFHKTKMSEMTSLQEKQLYHVVNKEFPAFVVHGSGKIPQAEPFPYDRSKLQ